MTAEVDFIFPESLALKISQPDPEPTPELLALIKNADTPTAEEAAEAEIDRGLFERSWEQFKKMGGWKNQQQVKDLKTGEFILVDPP